MNVHSPGTRLGQFEVISYPVFRDVTVEYTCLDHERSCPAVLKALRPELLSSQAARECFAQCGVVWAGLGDHPHIVRCHGVFQPENSDGTYLVLQAVIPEKERDTPSLLSWFIPGKPLPVSQALLFALQIARGMHYVANKIPGFVHGDLKPENILVSEDRLLPAKVNRLRVADFGLAAVLRTDDVDLSKLYETGKATVGQTQLINGISGTPLYMSPEQWRGENAGTATDVYALGCLLYKMLVGRHVAGGETARDLQKCPLHGTCATFARHSAQRCLRPDHSLPGIRANEPISELGRSGEGHRGRLSKCDQAARSSDRVVGCRG